MISSPAGVAPTPLARCPCEEAAPIVLPAPGALSALIAVRHLDLAPVVPSNQATPVFCHDAFPWFEDVPCARRGTRRARPHGPSPPAGLEDLRGGPRPAVRRPRPAALADLACFTICWGSVNSALPCQRVFRRGRGRLSVAAKSPSTRRAEHGPPVKPSALPLEPATAASATWAPQISHNSAGE